MSTKHSLILFAAALAVCLAPPARSQETAPESRQVQASRTVLAVQPSALAGSKSPLIPPTIATVKPAGIRRGTSGTFTLEGRNLAGVEHVLFNTSGLSAKLTSVADVAEKARQIHLNVDLNAEVPQGKKQKAEIQITAAKSLRPGLYWFRIQTPLGTSNMMPFDVGDLPEVATIPSAATSPQPVRLPATIVGAILTPGEVNQYEFTGKKDENAVFRVTASKIGSPLRSVLTLTDASGHQLAQTGKFAAEPDAVMVYKLPADGRYTLSISDQEEKAGPDHFYRMYAGDLPYIQSVFPLGVEAGHATVVHIQGVNLGGIHEMTVHPPARADGWTTLPLRITTARGTVSNTVLLAVNDEPQTQAAGSNDSAAAAQAVPIPVAVNGRLSQSAGNYFRFSAHKGERVSLAVAASRLGSPLDSIIEVLDSKGNPVPRAIVRCLNETTLTLADRDSRTRGYRLVSKTGFHDNDYLMVGEELDQIQFISDQPDEDILLKGFGSLRTALLGTSPEAHYVTEPAYRAEVLPPGAKFPPNGLPVFQLNYRNDDGGPGFGADSRLDFIAPADGEYLIHIADSRGLTGPDFAYQLIVNASDPDFTLSASPENPNIPRGGRMPIEVSADRMLGYQGPIEIKVLRLPAGVTAAPAVIPAGQQSATVILSASSDASADFAAEPFKVEGIGKVRGRDFTRVADAGAPLRVAALMPPPDIRVAATPQAIVLKPGETTNVTIQVTRENGFKGRVPCQVENLPPGVRVVNVGLNGVLVHSSESSHTFTLIAEPWAAPITQPAYIVGQVESDATTSHASSPITIKVEGKTQLAAAGQSGSGGQ